MVKIVLWNWSLMVLFGSGIQAIVQEHTKTGARGQGAGWWGGIRGQNTVVQPTPRTGIPYFPYSPEQWPVQWVLRTIAQK